MDFLRSQILGWSASPSLPLESHCLYPINLIDHCPSNYPAHSYRLTALSIFFEKDTYKQDPLEFLLQQALLCDRILLCHRIAKARFHLQCFLDVSYVAHTHVFLVSLYFSQTFPEFLWSSPLGPF